MYSARSMARDSSDSEDEHPFEINQNFEDSGPLTLVSPRDGGSGTGRSGAFNLREQLRLNTGILCTGNKPGGAFTMSFAQRKFMGFRCKYEYDAKAVLICSDKQIVLLTYTLDSLGESALNGVNNTENEGKTRNNNGRNKYEEDEGSSCGDEEDLRSNGIEKTLQQDEVHQARPIVPRLNLDKLAQPHSTPK